MSARRKGDLRVAVIGAGFGGIAVGVELRRHGYYNFVIFESSDGVGGTWHHNIYPGAEVDTPSHMYSYSFKPHDWSVPFAPQRELEEYLNSTVDEYDLREKVRLHAKVVSLHWQEEDQRWLLTLEDGSTDWFDAVVSAVGFLSLPNIPDWPGIDRFQGQIMHTARWDTSTQWAGQRVAVVGTGSSASQVVPALAPDADKLLLFQRQPGWVRQKGDNWFGEGERERLRSDHRYRQSARRSAFWVREKIFLGGQHDRIGGRVERAARESALEYINSVFADRPDLREVMTPDYPFGGKRTVQSSTFYPALLRDNVTVIPKAVVAMTESGIVDADGVEHEVDLVVMATGFRATDYLTELDVRGVGGRSLHDMWDGEPRAYLGTMVPGYPNFFMEYGPATNHYAVVFNIEAQARFAVRALERMRQRGTAIEVRKSWYRAFNWWLDRRMRNSTHTVVRNYFTTASGKVLTQWPDGIAPYWLATRLTLVPATKVRSRRHRSEP